MARVTVEDCIDKVPNRFELVLLAAHRARSRAKANVKLSRSESYLLQPFVANNDWARCS